MDELIFQFLLQAGYPRSSIVTEATLLTPGGSGPVSEDASTYTVVDPDTADTLAVIDVVEAIDEEALKQVAAGVGRYASRVGGRETQGFVIRVNPRGRSDTEQVQFFRVWPNHPIQQLSAKTFPDLDTLRVARRLSLSNALPVEPGIIDFAEGDGAGGRTLGAGDGMFGAEGRTFDAEHRSSAGLARRYVLALVLISIALADGYLVQTRGVGFLTLTQALLAVGAAVVATR